MSSSCPQKNILKMWTSSSPPTITAVKKDLTKLLYREKLDTEIQNCAPTNRFFSRWALNTLFLPWNRITNPIFQIHWIVSQGQLVKHPGQTTQLQEAHSLTQLHAAWIPDLYLDRTCDLMEDLLSFIPPLFFFRIVF